MDHTHAIYVKENWKVRKRKQKPWTHSLSTAWIKEKKEERELCVWLTETKKKHTPILQPMRDTSQHAWKLTKTSHLHQLLRKHISITFSTFDTLKYMAHQRKLSLHHTHGPPRFLVHKNGVSIKNQKLLKQKVCDSMYVKWEKKKVAIWYHAFP